jgi:hypothetical protein
VPVTTSDPMVKATAYVKPDQSMLIALGNFGSNKTTVTLTFKPGSDSSGGRGILSARAIEAYQPARTFKLEFEAGVGAGASAVSVGIPVQAKGGWLLERST